MCTQHANQQTNEAAIKLKRFRKDLSGYPFRRALYSNSSNTEVEKIKKQKEHYNVQITIISRNINWVKNH